MQILSTVNKVDFTARCGTQKEAEQLGLVLMVVCITLLALSVFGLYKYKLYEDEQKQKQQAINDLARKQSLTLRYKIAKKMKHVPSLKLSVNLVRKHDGQSIQKLTPVRVHPTPTPTTSSSASTADSVQDERSTTCSRPEPDTDTLPTYYYMRVGDENHGPYEGELMKEWYQSQKTCLVSNTLVSQNGLPWKEAIEYFAVAPINCPPPPAALLLRCCDLPSSDVLSDVLLTPNDDEWARQFQLDPMSVVEKGYSALHYVAYKQRKSSERMYERMLDFGEL